MDIQVNVNNQKLKVSTNLKTFISGTQEFIKFTFNFMDKIWDDLTIFAQFRQGDNAYNAYLDSSNSVYLPSEIVAGECLLTLHGAHDNVIAITDSLKLTIDSNNLITNAENIKISTSLYSQLMTKIGNDALNTEAQTIIGAINELYRMIQSL